MADSAEDRRTCFVIMPISMPDLHAERYEKRSDHFAQIREQLILPAVELAGFEPKSPERAGSENIHASIINDLRGAAMVLADLSTLNANVFLELGIRTALDKPICLIWDGFDSLPFDTGSINSHKYLAAPVYELNAEIAKLAQHLRDADATSTDGRNPLWKYFGTAADDDLTAAEVNPDDSSLEHKVDRLARLVELTLTQNRRAPNRRGGEQVRDRAVSRLASGHSHRADPPILEIVTDLLPTEITEAIKTISVMGPRPSESGYGMSVAVELDFLNDVAVEPYVPVLQKIADRIASMTEMHVVFIPLSTDSVNSAGQHMEIRSGVSPVTF